MRLVVANVDIMLGELSVDCHRAGALRNVRLYVRIPYRAGDRAYLTLV